MTYLSLEDRMMHVGKSIDVCHDYIHTKILTKSNLKYGGAEAAGFVTGHITSTAVAIYLNKIGASPLVNAASTTIADSFAFYIGNAGVFSLEHMTNYLNGTRIWKDDMKKLLISNGEATGVSFIAKFSSYLLACKYNFISYAWRPFLINTCAGIPGGLLRHAQNIKFKLLGFKGNENNKPKLLDDSSYIVD